VFAWRFDLREPLGDVLMGHVGKLAPEREVPGKPVFEVSDGTGPSAFLLFRQEHLY
jgi:hypothetical protein